MRRSGPTRHIPTVGFIVLLFALIAGASSCSPDNEAEPAGNAARGAADNPVDNPNSVSASGQSAVRGPTMTFQHAPITELDEILNSKNAEALTTRVVQLSGVKVQRVLRWPLILVGPSSDRVVLVQLYSQTPKIQPNQTIDISGNIAQMGRDLTQWNLSAEDKQVVHPHLVLINAVQVRVAGQQ